MSVMRKHHPSISRETVTVDGIVIPSAWDVDGAITGVSINTFDERSYRVAGKEVGEELAGLARRRVTAWGVVDGSQEMPVLILSGYRVFSVGEEC
jgi:hypothetical protein